LIAQDEYKHVALTKITMTSMTITR